MAECSERCERCGKFHRTAKCSGKMRASMSASEPTQQSAAKTSDVLSLPLTSIESIHVKCPNAVVSRSRRPGCPVIVNFEPGPFAVLIMARAQDGVVACVSITDITVLQHLFEGLQLSVSGLEVHLPRTPSRIPRRGPSSLTGNLSSSSPGASHPLGAHARTLPEAGTTQVTGGNPNAAATPRTE